jgi:hypothetical protein
MLGAGTNGIAFLQLLPTVCSGDEQLAPCLSRHEQLNTESVKRQPLPDKG